MQIIDGLILGFYFCLILAIGYYVRKIKSIKDFALAGQSFGAPVLVATLSASFIGGGFSFGNATTIFEGGLGLATTLWGFSLMLILVAKFIAPKIVNFRNCISIGDIFNKKLGKKPRIVAGILGTLVCIGILGAQVGALGAVFAQLTPLTFAQGVIVGCTIVILYTVMGGMRAVIWTDVLQFCILVVLIPVILLAGINFLGGTEAFVQKVPANYFTFVNDDFSIFMWIGLFLTFLIGETLVPPYMQRLLITKTAEQAQKGFFWSGILSIPFFIITGAIGLVALAVNPDVTSSFAMPMVTQTVLPAGLKTLAIVAIISIVMSSADSFLNSASVCLVEDIIKPIFEPKYSFTDKQILRVAKISTVIIGFASIVLALKIANVLEILKFAYNFWAPVILVPLVCILLGKSITKKAFWGGAIAGFSTVVSVFVFFDGSLYGFDACVVGALANLVVFLILNRQKKRIKITGKRKSL